MIIAIDGLSTNGKSTLAKMISENLNIKYFNTGAVYRCIALEIIKKNLDINDIKKCISHLKSIDIDMKDDKIFLSGNDVTKEIRTEIISIKSTDFILILKLE